MNPERTTVHLSITGAVQGVFYRASMQSEARRLGLDGWVRNRSDGSVEAQVQGPPARVQQMVQWCHAGPPRARVQAVHCTPLEDAQPCSGFDCRETL